MTCADLSAEDPLLAGFIVSFEALTESQRSCVAVQNEPLFSPDTQLLSPLSPNLQHKSGFYKTMSIDKLETNRFQWTVRFAFTRLLFPLSSWMLPNCWVSPCFRLLQRAVSFPANPIQSAKVETQNVFVSPIFLIRYRFVFVGFFCLYCKHLHWSLKICRPNDYACNDYWTWRE